MPGQLSFLTAGTRPPEVDDLDGALLGGGQLVRLGGTARLSAVVRDQWRVDALLALFGELDLAGERLADEDGSSSVRTAFVRRLAPLADRWVHGSVKVLPRPVLDGPKLRTWAIAAGRVDAQGYVLGMGAGDDAVWERAGLALAGAGLTATMLSSRTDGPGYRVAGRRRLARLAEYLGEPPVGARACWP